jgi:uncharacterized RDD family membrane protein YckC
MANQQPDWYAPPAPNASSSASPDAGEYADPEYVGFGTRFGARLIDFIVAMVCGTLGGAVGGVLAAMLAAAGVVAPGWLNRLQGLSAGSFAFGVLASLAYHGLSEGMGGASLGKLVLGLRVKREDLRPCGVGPALVRNLAYYIDGFFFGLVAYSVMSKSRQQQRLGDQWGHTVVVRAASLPASYRESVGLGLILGILGHVILSGAGVVVRAM